MAPLQLNISLGNNYALQKSTYSINRNNIYKPMIITNQTTWNGQQQNKKYININKYIAQKLYEMMFLYNPYSSNLL